MASQRSRAGCGIPSAPVTVDWPPSVSDMSYGSGVRRRRTDWRDARPVSADWMNCRPGALLSSRSACAAVGEAQAR